MSYGCLVNEIQKDTDLTSYGIVFIDDLHAESKYKELLVGLMHRVMTCSRRSRNSGPLKLILSSSSIICPEEFESLRQIFPTLTPVSICVEPLYSASLEHVPISSTLEIVELIVRINSNSELGDVLVFLGCEDQIHAVHNLLLERLRCIGSQMHPLVVFGIHSTISYADFLAMLNPLHQVGARKVLLATGTSISDSVLKSSDVRFVVDSGKCEQTFFESSTTRATSSALTSCASLLQPPRNAAATPDHVAPCFVRRIRLARERCSSKRYVIITRALDRSLV